MTYKLETNTVLFELDRTAIVDISTGDKIEVCCLSDAVHEWTEQDSQFMESNPDARLFVRFERTGDQSFKGLGLTVMSHEIS